MPHRRTWPFGGLPVPKAVVYKHYVAFCRNNRVARTAEIDSTAFKQLYQLVPFAANKEITARDNYAQQDATRPACLKFPTLNECRKAWCEKYGEVGTEGWDNAGGDDVSYDTTQCGLYQEPSWMVI